MSEAVKTVLAIVVVLCAIVVLTLIFVSAVNDSRAPAVECVEAPQHALALDSIQAAERGGDLWVCGLGDQGRMPAFRCYPMRHCESAR